MLSKSVSYLAPQRKIKMTDLNSIPFGDAGSTVIAEHTVRTITYYPITEDEFNRISESGGNYTTFLSVAIALITFCLGVIVNRLFSDTSNPHVDVLCYFFLPLTAIIAVIFFFLASSEHRNIKKRKNDILTQSAKRIIETNQPHDSVWPLATGWYDWSNLSTKFTGQSIATIDSELKTESSEPET